MSYRRHFGAVLTLGLPLAGSQIAQVSLSLVDAAMLGWYDTTALAGEIIGSSLFFVLFIAGSGFSAALAPLVAAAEGRGDTTQARRVTRMGLWLAMLAALVSLPVLLNAEPIFLALGQKPEIAAAAGDYLSILAWGLFPAHAAMALKSYLAALERSRMVLIATLVSVVVNAAGNYALIFGHWGAPELGIRGAAWSSLIMHFATLAFLVAYVRHALPGQEVFVRLWRPDWEAFGAVFRLGWPISLTLICEVGLFAFSSVMMGWIGEIPLVAHGIAMQITSVTFMVHLGLSQAATVRAGRAHGRGTMTDIRRGAVTAIILSGIVSLLTIAVFLAWPEVLIGLFIDPASPVRAEVLAFGTILLAASALYQLTDAYQVIALGILRGLQDTQRPMLVAAVSYWIVGVPVAYILTFKLGVGGVGIWFGMACGLAMAAVWLMYRLWRQVMPRIQREISLQYGIKAGTAPTEV
ncbi:MATE family efflux transporter [Pseudooceanicola algae]|nr:MATE family efflux transporter [Pseudooceanicola algae]